MEIMGYSERGVINSLFYEIFYNNNQDALKKILAMAYFPVDESISNHFKDPAYQINKIFLEQSFSDFGDSDVVILASNGSEKEIIFIEAKVSQNTSNDIESFYNNLIKKITKISQNAKEENKKYGLTSNLFSQLYLKQRLVDKQTMKDGKTFIEGCLKKGKSHERKIGNNIVVNRVFKELKECISDSFYISIIPGELEKSKKFIKNELLPKQEYIQNSFDPDFNWNMNEWGFLFWSEIYDKFLKNPEFPNLMSPEFPNTKKIFESNKTQILSSEKKNNHRESNKRKDNNKMKENDKLTIDDFFIGLNDTEKEYFGIFIEELLKFGITCKMGGGGKTEGKGKKSFNTVFKRKQNKKENKGNSQPFRLGGGRNWRENNDQDATIYLSKSAEESKTTQNDDVSNIKEIVFSELYKFNHFESVDGKYLKDEWKISDIKDAFPPERMAELFYKAKQVLEKHYI